MRLKYSLIAFLFPIGLLSCNSIDDIKDKEDKEDNTVDISTLQPIDLGLSVYWANKNLGAKDIYDLGKRYVFGDVNEALTTQNEFPKLIGTFGCISGTDMDVAKFELGNGWRLPTAEELYELKGKLSWSFYNKDNKIGNVGSINNQTIFIPCSNYNSTNNRYEVFYMSGSYIYDKGYGYYTQTLSCASTGCEEYSTICGQNDIGIKPGSNKFYVRPVKDK